MNGDGVDARQLRALVAVTEEGGFTGAATRLGVTQSAVSRTIASLETRLNVSLLTRTTRAVSLTDAGVRTYRAAVNALAALDAVAAAASGRPTPLRLGFGWSALGRYTSPVLRGWRSEYPAVPLEVHRDDAGDGGLARGAVDVAVVRGEFERSDTVVQLIFREPRVAALPADHRLATQESVLLAELRDETVLTTGYGITRLELWPAEIRPQVALMLDNTDEWVTEIAGGLGVGVMSESTSVQHAHPGVVYVPLDDAEWLPVQLAWPQRPHPAVADFVELVTRVVAGG